MIDFFIFESLDLADASIEMHDHLSICIVSVEREPIMVDMILTISPHRSRPYTDMTETTECLNVRYRVGYRVQRAFEAECYGKRNDLPMGTEF